MKKIFIMAAAILLTATAFSQKAKLNEHYKNKKAVYAAPVTNANTQVSSKEAMKMDAVKYNRIINPADINTANSKYMALSKKEHMKREVVKINNRPNKVSNTNIADSKPGKDSAAAKDDTAEE